MQFKTKLGLVDIPNTEVLAAADAIRGPVASDQPAPAASDLEREVWERRKDAHRHAEQVRDLVDLARKCGATEEEIVAIRNPR